MLRVKNISLLAQGERSLPLQTVPVGQQGGKKGKRCLVVLFTYLEAPAAYNLSALSEHAEQMIANPLLA